LDKAEIVFEKLAKMSEFKILKKYRTPLTSEEQKTCLQAKAVWNFTGKPTPAVWKSISPSGKVTYVTNTHRAYNTASTLKGAIRRYHVFIKGTA
jgi:hypothetical protein